MYRNMLDIFNHFASCEDLCSELKPKCCGGETIQQRSIVIHFDRHDVMKETAENCTESCAWMYQSICNLFFFDVHK